MVFLWFLHVFTIPSLIGTSHTLPPCQGAKVSAQRYATSFSAVLSTKVTPAPCTTNSKTIPFTWPWEWAHGMYGAKCPWDVSRKSHGGEPPGTMKNDHPMIFWSAWSNPRLALDGFVEIKTRSKGLKPSFPDSVAILEVHPMFRQIHIFLAYWSNILILHI